MSPCFLMKGVKRRIEQESAGWKWTLFFGIVCKNPAWGSCLVNWYVCWRWENSLHWGYNSGRSFGYGHLLYCNNNTHLPSEARWWKTDLVRWWCHLRQKTSQTPSMVEQPLSIWANECELRQDVAGCKREEYYDKVKKIFNCDKTWLAVKRGVLWQSEEDIWKYSCKHHHWG